MRWMYFLLTLALSLDVLAAKPGGEDIVQQIEKVRDQLTSQEEKQRQVLSALYSLNRKIKRIVSEKGNLQREHLLLDASIKELEDQIAEGELSTKKQRSHLAKRLRAMTILSASGWTKFFLTSQTPADLDRNLKLLGIIAQRDKELIQNYQADLRTLRSKKEKLAQRQSKLAKTTEELLKKETLFLADISTKSRLLEKVKRSKLFSISKLQDLKKLHSEYNLDDLGIMDSFVRPSFAEKKGRLALPTRGNVKKKFGLIRSSDHTYTLNHKGIFIETQNAEQVRAVAEGRVIFSDSIEGYGRTLILDHGDHYYTVYSHLDQALVPVGKELTRDEVVGRTGYSVMNEMNGLYFEVRHFSEPYDPAQWLKGLSL